MDLLLSCLLLATTLFAHPQIYNAPDDPRKDPPVVKKILKVDYMIQESDPPNLHVEVVGQVPTAGYTNVKLVRVKYKQPPKDGIQEYRLAATPPDGPAAQVITEVKASDTWRGFTKEATWVKGIRVLGVGDGVVERKF